MLIVFILQFTEKSHKDFITWGVSCSIKFVSLSLKKMRFIFPPSLVLSFFYQTQFHFASGSLCDLYSVCAQNQKTDSTLYVPSAISKTDAMLTQLTTLLHDICNNLCIVLCLLKLDY